eukprot:364395-Chlamydomonas_euryale.AAC.1
MAHDLVHTIKPQYLGRCSAFLHPCDAQSASRACQRVFAPVALSVSPYPLARPLLTSPSSPVSSRAAKFEELTALRHAHEACASGTHSRHVLQACASGMCFGHVLRACASGMRFRCHVDACGMYAACSLHEVWHPSPYLRPAPLYLLS